MKKFAALMVILVLVAAPLLLSEMTADEIISKHIAAIGGEKAFKDIKSLVATGSMFVSGMPLDIKSYIVTPDKAYMEASTNNMTVMSGGSNGTDAWQMSPQTGAVLLEGEAKRSTMEQAELSPLLNYKEKGDKVKYLGEDMVKGAKAYKVEVVDTANDSTTYYFDAGTYYILRQKSKGGTVTFSKHQKVDDKIVRPFKINIAGPAAQGQIMITFDTMQVNVPVPDSLFVVPAGAISQSEFQQRMEQMRQKMQGGGQQGGGKAQPDSAK
jgi:outer membrane lipoprotein-sorting protein